MRSQTVLQGRAPWHGPVACVPGQIHSSMVRPPSQAQNNLPVAAESLARKLECMTILRHGRQHDLPVALESLVRILERTTILRHGRQHEVPVE